MSIRGWVYVITNKAMPGLVKIGYSTKDPVLRAMELDNTGSPHPYFVEYDVLVNDPRDHEQELHGKFSDRREGKEWFRCSVAEVVQAIRDSLGNEILIENIKCDLAAAKPTGPQCAYNACTRKGELMLGGKPYCTQHYNELQDYLARLEPKKESY